MDFILTQADIQRPGFQINLNHVAVFERGNRAACRRFRGDMPNAGPARAAAETPIGDERYFVAQSLPHDGRSRREHFLHSGAALWPLITDNDHVAGLHFARQDAANGLFLALVNPGRAAEFHHIRRHPADFDHRAMRSQVAEQYRQPAMFGMGVFVAANHIVVLDFAAFDGFPQADAGYRDPLEMQNPGVALDFVQNCRDSARAVDILHVPLAGW